MILISKNIQVTLVDAALVSPIGTPQMHGVNAGVSQDLACLGYDI
jgi:hypothetical protein